MGSEVGASAAGGLMSSEVEEMFSNRLKKRYKHLSKWARRAGVFAFRVYDGDIPELPLVVDFYDGHLHMAARAGRGVLREEDLDQDAWLRRMGLVAGAALGVAPERVFVKLRQRQTRREQYRRLSPTAYAFPVREGAVRLWVDLQSYVDTGLFLDHRPSRLRLAEVARGGRLLNLFAYTGAFSVHAAAAGAETTVSVDLSRTYLSWAEDNFRLNGFDEVLLCDERRGPALPEGRGHFLWRGAVDRFLAKARDEQRRYEVIVVDPPTFSNSKRTVTHFDVQRDHVALLRRCAALLVPGGLLFFSTNRQRFQLDAAALAPGLVGREVSAQSVGEDFRQRRPHRAWEFVRG